MADEQTILRTLEAGVLKAVAAGKTSVEDALDKLTGIRTKHIGHVVREALQNTENATDALMSVQGALVDARVALGPEGARVFENFESMLVHGAEKAGSQVSQFFDHTTSMSPESSGLGSREIRPGVGATLHYARRTETEK